MEKIKKNLFQKLLYILFFLLLFILNGCMSYRHLVQVSSYTSNENFGKKYFVQASEKKIKDRNLALEIKEFEKYIDIILEQKGYIKTNNLKDAEQIIIFDYNISEPQVYTYSYDEPVWDTVLYPEVRYREIDGKYYPYTYWDRDYEIIGYRTKVRTKILYTKSIFLNSFNRTKNKSFWQVNGSITDTSNDLRYSFPFILKGMKNYIGTSSGQAINVEIPENDIDVEMMKRGVIDTSTVAKE